MSACLNDFDLVMYPYKYFSCSTVPLGISLHVSDTNLPKKRENNRPHLPREIFPFTR